MRVQKIDWATLFRLLSLFLYSKITGAVSAPVPLPAAWPGIGGGRRAVQRPRPEKGCHVFNVTISREYMGSTGPAYPH